MKSTNTTLHSPEIVPTVFLHGFSGEANGLRAFADLYSGPDALCINLPGFGGSTAPSFGKSDDIYTYCDDIWREIRRVVPEGPINLVGHSHGAMVSYVLAVQHPDVIQRLDLFCPVARPQFIPRSLIGLVRLLNSTGVSPDQIIRVGAHPFLVRLVTRYMFHPDWSAEDRQRIIEMRTREAKFYSPIMFDLMQQTVRFAETMKESRCRVPTRICHTSDDNVASPTDYAWYQDHADVVKIKEITGGHLCVVANPSRVVSLFGHEED
jgi:pimeloyl-ACP methyl ester carboxylesterase